MSRQQQIRYGGPAAMLGGVLFLVAAAAAFLIYFVFAEEARHTFFGQHAFIHMLDVAAFAMLLVGAVAVYARQKGRLGKAGKAGFFLTVAGFGLSVAGGLTIIAVGLAVSDEATLGALDAVTHPLAHLIYAVGSLLFGISTFRAGILPRPAALLVALGPISLLAIFVAGLGQSTVLPLVPLGAMALGWAWLGHALYSEESAPEPELAVR